LSGKSRKHVPLRTCIACQQKRPKRELIRIVRTPEGSIEIDPKGKMAGRGAYVCHDPHCWTMLSQKGLGRALKCQVGTHDMVRLKSGAQSLFSDSAVAQSEDASV
jgi:predicted RNA-binding protein YlxR (DUF448 family)